MPAPDPGPKDPSGLIWQRAQRDKRLGVSTNNRAREQPARLICTRKDRLITGTLHDCASYLSENWCCFLLQALLSSQGSALSPQ